MKQSDTELRECPFCKVAPIVVDGIDNGTQKASVGFGTILCDNDVCGVNPSVDYYNGFEQGADVWNGTPSPITEEEAQYALGPIEYEIELRKVRGFEQTPLSDKELETIRKALKAHTGE